MTRISSLAFALLIITAFGLQSASAQFPIKVPEFPGIKKPKADPPRTAGRQSEPAAAPTAGTSVASPDQPTIAKDSVQVKAFTNSSYRKDFSVWSWVPKITFRVNGPLASGSQLSVEYLVPGSAPVRFDCATQETQKDHWSQTECGGPALSEDKNSTYTGPVNFAIKLRNELAGTESTLFTGKMQVAKARSNESGPQADNHFVYYVDHDWNLPIGYLFYSPDQVFGWDYAVFQRGVLGARGRSPLRAPLVLPGPGSRYDLQARLHRGGGELYIALRGRLAAAEGEMGAREVPLPGSEELGQDARWARQRQRDVHDRLEPR
jgi:hypothetical protein